MPLLHLLYLLLLFDDCGGREGKEGRAGAFGSDVSCMRSLFVKHKAMHTISPVVSLPPNYVTGSEILRLHTHTMLTTVGGERGIDSNNGRCKATTVGFGERGWFGWFEKIFG